MGEGLKSVSVGYALLATLCVTASHCVTATDCVSATRPTASSQSLPRLHHSFTRTRKYTEVGTNIYRGFEKTAWDVLVPTVENILAGIKADHVSESKWAERMAGAELHRRVHVLLARISTLNQPDRLKDGGDEEAVNDEARRVLAVDRRLADVVAVLGELLEGGVRGVGASNQLQQLHHRHGVEEMNAGKERQPFCLACRLDVDDFKGGGVGGEDALLRCRCVERCKDGLLELYLLGHSFNDEICLLYRLCCRHARRDARHSFVLVLVGSDLIHLSCLDGFLETAQDRLLYIDARLVQELLAHVYLDRRTTSKIFCLTSTDTQKST